MRGVTIIAAADGSALGNPGPAGWGWYVDDACWAWPGPRTPPTWPSTALLDLLQQTAHLSDDLLVHCDSTYVINSVTKWMPGWKRRGWRKGDGKPVLNVEIMKALDEAMSGRRVRLAWSRATRVTSSTRPRTGWPTRRPCPGRPAPRPTPAPVSPAPSSGTPSRVPGQTVDEPDLFSFLLTRPGTTTRPVWRRPASGLAQGSEGSIFVPRDVDPMVELEADLAHHPDPLEPAVLVQPLAGRVGQRHKGDRGVHAGHGHGLEQGGVEQRRPPLPRTAESR